MVKEQRKYYSSRIKGSTIDFDKLFELVKTTYYYFRDKDYFKEKLEITYNNIPDHAKSKSTIALRENILPIKDWVLLPFEDDKIFDAIEFFYDHISKPGEMGNFTGETGFNYSDYISYDSDLGKQEYREIVNSFLCDYKKGYELSLDGEIQELIKHGLEEIIDADLPIYDEENVNKLVDNAISKFRSRNSNLNDKKSAIKDLADVLEFLRKKLKEYKILSKSDDGSLFEIANNYSIRHHSEDQHKNYDKSIWFSWIFHSYLATIHAGIRLLMKYESKKDF